MTSVTLAQPIVTDTLAVRTQEARITVPAKLAIGEMARLVLVGYTFPKFSWHVQNVQLYWVLYVVDILSRNLSNYLYYNLYLVKCVEHLAFTLGQWNA